MWNRPREYLGGCPVIINKSGTCASAVAENLFGPLSLARMPGKIANMEAMSSGPLFVSGWEVPGIKRAERFFSAGILCGGWPTSFTQANSWFFVLAKTALQTSVSARGQDEWPWRRSSSLVTAATNHLWVVNKHPINCHIVIVNNELGSMFGAC